MILRTVRCACGRCRECVGKQEQGQFFIVSGGAGFGEESVEVGGGADGGGALEVGERCGIVAGDHIVVA